MKADPATSKDVTVVGAVAVKVAVPPVDWETIVEAKFTFEPDSAGVVEGRAPKPSKVPSLVPTYTIPLSTPGSENTVDVNVPDCQISSIVPLDPGFTGTALKASSWESAPLELLA